MVPDARGKLKQSKVELNLMSSSHKVLHEIVQMMACQRMVFKLVTLMSAKFLYKQNVDDDAS